MIITLDYPTSDPNYSYAIGGEEEPFELYDFVLITNKDKHWIGQIKKPNINISAISGISPFDPPLLHALMLSQQLPDTPLQILNSTEKWEIFLMGEFNAQTNMLQTLRRRPKPAAIVTKLDRTRTIKVLNLPTLEQFQDQTYNIIGVLENAEDVPLCISPTILNHHIMVSGGTGSGKSNACANIIFQASKYGYCTILYDAKPDYRLMDEANSEEKIAPIFERFEQYQHIRQPAQRVKRVCFYNGDRRDYRNYDAVLGFTASDLDPLLFANLFLPDTASEMQVEEFYGACRLLYTEKIEGKRRTYTLQNILNTLEQKSQAYLKAKDQFGNAPVRAVIRNILRKIEKNAYPWLDKVGTQIPSQNVFEQPRSVEKFDPKRLVEAGAIIHVDMNTFVDDSDYALFLGVFFKECQRYRRDKTHAIPILQFVDEAHRIFDNVSRHSKQLDGIFNRTMREGRTLSHGVVLSLQNANQIPANVMNNINSHIVMRQNSIEIAKAATQAMGKDEAFMTIGLPPGQALVKMFESSSVVLTQMSPSPFELERPDNKARIIERGLI